MCIGYLAINAFLCNGIVQKNWCKISVIVLEASRYTEYTYMPSTPQKELKIP